MVSRRQWDRRLKRIAKIAKTGPLDIHGLSGGANGTMVKVLDQLQRQLSEVQGATNELIEHSRRGPNWAELADGAGEFGDQEVRIFAIDYGDVDSNNVVTFVHEAGLILNRWIEVAGTNDYSQSAYPSQGRSWGTWRIRTSTKDKTEFQVDYDFVEYKRTAYVLGYQSQLVPIDYKGEEELAGAGFSGNQPQLSDAPTTGAPAIVPSGSLRWAYDDLRSQTVVGADVTMAFGTTEESEGTDIVWSGTEMTSQMDGHIAFEYTVSLGIHPGASGPDEVMIWMERDDGSGYAELPGTRSFYRT